MGPTWVLSAPDGPHFGPMTLLSGQFYSQQHSRLMVLYSVKSCCLTGKGILIINLRWCDDHLMFILWRQLKLIFTAFDIYNLSCTKFLKIMLPHIDCLCNVLVEFFISVVTKANLSFRYLLLLEMNFICFILFHLNTMIEVKHTSNKIILWSLKDFVDYCILVLFSFLKIINFIKFISIHLYNRKKVCIKALANLSWLQPLSWSYL